MTLYLSTTLCEWNCECSGSSWMGLSLVPGHGPWCFWSASMLGIVLCVLPSPNPRTARWGNVPTEIRVSAGPALTSISAFPVGSPMARQLLHFPPKREEHIESDCLRQSHTASLDSAGLQRSDYQLPSTGWGWNNCLAAPVPPRVAPIVPPPHAATERTV